MNDDIETVMPQSDGDQGAIERALADSDAGGASEEDEAVVPEAPETADDVSYAAPRDQPDPLIDIANQLGELKEETAGYHARSARREAVIDTMHAELERLRRGERRSMLRPLVTEVCRIRDDLLRQAGALPDDFDRDRAAALLRSYADSLEFTLEDNGVSSFAPEVGDAFQASVHRPAGKAPTHEDALVGTVAEVLSPGYRDIEADVVISNARVVVHVADQKEHPEEAAAVPRDPISE